MLWYQTCAMLSMVSEPSVDDKVLVAAPMHEKMDGIDEVIDDYLQNIDFVLL